jgi:hypothetical protein
MRGITGFLKVLPMQKVRLLMSLTFNLHFVLLFKGFGSTLRHSTH